MGYFTWSTCYQLSLNLKYKKIESFPLVKHLQFVMPQMWDKIRMPMGVLHFISTTHSASGELATEHAHRLDRNNKAISVPIQIEKIATQSR